MYLIFLLLLLFWKIFLDLEIFFGKI